MKDLIEVVQQLMVAGGQLPGDYASSLYHGLIEEEHGEWRIACRDDDEVEEFDGCLDLIWVTVGYMIARGWPIEAGWAEVVRSNLAKIGPDGKIHKRADGKILKPEGWTPPNLSELLATPKPEGGA